MNFELTDLGIALNLPLLVLVGGITGILSAFFGLGGGWVITPVLNFLGLPMAHAVGTGLGFIFGTSLFSAWRHRKKGNVAARVGAVIVVGMLGGMECGKNLVLRMESTGHADASIRLLYAIFLLTVGVFMVWENLRKRDTVESAVLPLFRRVRLGPYVGMRGTEWRVSVWPLIGTGLVAGLLSGMLGVGGGIIILPVLVYLCGTTTVAAVGTSLLCICLAAPFGIVRYAAAGKVEFAAAGIMVLGALGGAAFGVYATGWVKGRFLRLLYGACMVAGAGAVLLMQAGQRAAALAVIFLAAGSMALTVITLTFTARHRAKAATTAP